MTAATLSPPETKAGKLQRACLALLQQHEREGTIPTNGRFLFYELEQKGIISKAYRDASGNKRARTPAQDISDATMRLRELGLVPWDWILDESRKLTTWRYAASMYEYVVETVPLARIDCWGGEPPPLIICEARATAGVLERIAAEYLCPITATGGQSGGHIVNEIVPLLADNDRKVLYIGNCEVDGPADQIEANTPAPTSRLTPGADSPPRLGSGLRSRPSKSPAVRACANKPSTSSTTATGPRAAISLSNVGQAVLERMLRKALDAMLPEPLANVQVREERQRTKLRTVLANLTRTKRAPR